MDGAATGVLRQQIPFTRLSLTEFVLPVKRNQKSAKVAEKFKAGQISEKWSESGKGKQQVARLRRATLTDFERFQLMVSQKKKGLAVRQELNKLKPKVAVRQEPNKPKPKNK